jgi:hypothetical protein
MVEKSLHKVYVGNVGTRTVVVIHDFDEVDEFGETKPRPGRDSYVLPTYGHVVNHSPDGFAWGYGGSGPHQLALAILMDLYDRTRALQCYDLFCHQKIAKLPQHMSFKLPQEEIDAWMEKYMEGVRWRTR